MASYTLTRLAVAELLVKVLSVRTKEDWCLVRVIKDWYWKPKNWKLPNGEFKLNFKAESITAVSNTESKCAQL